MRVGITGHQVLPARARAFLDGRLRELFQDGDRSLEAVSALAAGSDQAFAQFVLQRGGRLHAVIPCEGYESTFTSKADLDAYSLLVAGANRVEQLQHKQPSEQAFLDAGKRVVDEADWLVAVWDGEAAHGHGGTADVVKYAYRLHKRVEVIWPQGVRR